jgi:amidohydrolase
MGSVQGVSLELAEKLVTFRRTLHQHPELSLQEFETTRRIREFLLDHGIEPLDYPLETGVLAVVQGKHPGPCIAIRTDIDALPIVEETGLAFRSTVDGKMHACGHDFHTAGVLGAALLAKEAADSEASFAGSILFVFQPAEEVGNGAILMMKSGAFEDHQVRAIIGEHNNPRLQTGQIGVKAGPLMASVDEFRIVVKGVGGHAAIPEFTVDPILVASNIVAGLQHVVSRTVSPLDSVVVTVGKFQAGTASNIIPMEAVIEGTVRCLQPHAQDLVEERLRAFVEQTASAYGARAEVEYLRILPGVVNDAELASLVRDCAVQVMGEEHVEEAVPSLGGEDFALYQKRIPGCFFWVGTGKSDGTSFGWHHPSFDVDESMIPATSQLFVQAAFEWLRQNA